MRRLLLVVALIASPAGATVSVCGSPVEAPLWPIPDAPRAEAIRLSSTTTRVTFTNTFVTDLYHRIDLGAPAVTVIGDEIQVTQSLNELVSPAEANPPIIHLCQRDILDVTGLRSDCYRLRWTYVPADGGDPRTAVVPVVVSDSPSGRLRKPRPDTPPPPNPTPTPVPVLPVPAQQSLPFSPPHSPWWAPRYLVAEGPTILADGGARTAAQLFRR